MWIGVDFGTYKTCISHWYDGNYHIICDDFDRYIINNIKITDGNLVMSKYRTNSTIHSIKRTIGLNSQICEKDVQDKLMMFLLNNIVNIAEKQLRDKITGFVMVIPDHYGQYQRKLLVEYGKKIGVNIRLIHDSTAAALSFQNKFPISDHKKILIYNLGAGNVTVSIATISAGSVMVEETISDNIGADDCDYLLAKYLAEKHDIKGIKEHNYLITECKRVKHVLSGSSTAVVELSLEGNTEVITRDIFEMICQSTLIKLLEPAKTLLSKHNVDKVVMIGGGSRINYIKRTITSPDKLCQSLNPEEAVAIGASIHAGILNGDSTVPDNMYPFQIISNNITLINGSDQSDKVVLFRAGCGVPHKTSRQICIKSSPVIRINEGITSNPIISDIYKLSTCSEKEVNIDVTIDINGIIGITMC